MARRWSRLILTAIASTVLLVVLGGSIPPVAANASPASTSPHNAVVASIPLPPSAGDPSPGTYQGTPIYDSSNGNLYLPTCALCLGEGSLIAVSGATNQVVGVATVGWEPYTVSVDPSTGDVFVPNCPCAYGNPPPPNVTVISGVTNQAIASIAMPGAPSVAVYDPWSGGMFVSVANNSTVPGYVVLISGSTLSIVGEVAVGYDPNWMVFNPVNGYLYVLDSSSVSNISSGSNELSVIAERTMTRVDTIALPASARYAPLFDDRNGDLYFGTPHEVVVVSSSTNQVIRTIASPSPWPTFVDPQGNAYMFESGYPANLTEISGSTNTVVGTYSLGPADRMAYDPANGNVYSTEWQYPDLNVTSTVTQSLVQTLTLAPNGPWARPLLAFAPTYDPGNGDLYVFQFGSPDHLLVIGNASVPAASPSGGLSYTDGVIVGAAGGVGAATLAAIGIGVLLRRRGREPGSEQPPQA